MLGKVALKVLKCIIRLINMIPFPGNLIVWGIIVLGLIIAFIIYWVQNTFFGSFGNSFSETSIQEMEARGVKAETIYLSEDSEGDAETRYQKYMEIEKIGTDGTGTYNKLNGISPLVNTKVNEVILNYDEMSNQDDNTKDKEEEILVKEITKQTYKYVRLQEGEDGYDATADFYALAYEGDEYKFNSEGIDNSANGAKAGDTVKIPVSNIINPFLLKGNFVTQLHMATALGKGNTKFVDKFLESAKSTIDFEEKEISSYIKQEETFEVAKKLELAMSDFNYKKRISSATTEKGTITEEGLDDYEFINGSRVRKYKLKKENESEIGLINGSTRTEIIKGNTKTVGEYTISWNGTNFNYSKMGTTTTEYNPYKNLGNDKLYIYTGEGTNWSINGSIATSPSGGFVIDLNTGLMQDGDSSDKNNKYWSITRYNEGDAAGYVGIVPNFKINVVKFKESNMSVSGESIIVDYIEYVMYDVMLKTDMPIYLITKADTWYGVFEYENSVENYSVLEAFKNLDYNTNSSLDVVTSKLKDDTLKEHPENALKDGIGEKFLQDLDEFDIEHTDILLLIETLKSDTDTNSILTLKYLYYMLKDKLNMDVSKKVIEYDISSVPGSVWKSILMSINSEMAKKAISNYKKIYDLKIAEGLKNYSTYGAYGWDNQNLNEKTEGLRTTVEAIARELGLDQNLIPVIMAIIMQESGGETLESWPDVMCCSESLGLPINTLGTEESIRQGVKVFMGHYVASGNNIEIALQSYNFGVGFISYALENGGYSLEVAKAYSVKMANQMGWSDYGDYEYVEHVKRFLIQKVGDYSSLLDVIEQLVASGISYSSPRTYGDYDVSDYVCTDFVIEAFINSIGLDIQKEAVSAGYHGARGINSGMWQYLRDKQTIIYDWSSSQSIVYSNIQVGDIVGWDTYEGDEMGGHVGIYVGNNMCAHNGSSRGVSYLSLTYYPITFVARITNY